jgi:hypothetical protein
MGRKLTLRGVIGSGSIATLLDYEGVDLTVGWKVISGNCLNPGSPNTSSKGLILHTDDVVKTSLSFGDNQIIGWVGGPPNAVNQVIDPNHVIVNTLYASGLAAVTYVIVIEQIKIDPIQNVVYQLKERAQATIE